VPIVLLIACSLIGCDDSNDSSATTAQHRNTILLLAVTTSTNDSGLLDVLIPVFEQRTGARVDTLATGTGKALKLGENGDVDVVLVHAREAEDRFMQAGHGVRHEHVMYNTFELLGPRDDPAQVRGLNMTEALQQIAAGEHPFVSRGDDSGTHKQELLLWRFGNKAANTPPQWDRYVESGQGQGATLIIASQMRAYVLTDLGTYLRFKGKIDLQPMHLTGKHMRNPYSIMAVNPDKSDRINHELASTFIDFVISPDAQRLIRDFTIAGAPLFVPLRLDQ
jgi:tungstate transport system substrate-binding protein